MIEAHNEGPPGLGALVGNVIDNARRLLRQEIALVKLEVQAQLREVVATTGRGVALMMAAALFALLAIAFLGLAFLLGLTAAFDWPLWLSALIVAVVYLLVAGALGFAGRAILQGESDTGPADAEIVAD